MRVRPSPPGQVSTLIKLRAVLDSLPARFIHLAEILNRRQVSEDEAARRARSFPPLSEAQAAYAADMAAAPLEILPEPAVFLLEDLEVGTPQLFSTLERRRNFLLLLHENVRPRDGSSLGSRRAMRDLINATIDLLTEKHDPILMEKATRLVGELAAEDQSAEALIMAGRVHFEPYSVGPGYESYLHGIAFRKFRQAWAEGYPLPIPDLDRFPGYDESLNQAAIYFQQAADLGRGVVRGRGLAYFALVALTGHMLGRPIDTRRITEMIEEADRLLPRQEDPTVWGRLFLFTGDLDDPAIMFRHPPLHLRSPGLLVATFGVHATVSLFLAGIDAALAAGDRTQVAALSRLLMAYLPRTGMEQARIAIMRSLAHCLPGDPTSCRDHEVGIGPDVFLDRGDTTAAVHSLYHHACDPETFNRIGDSLSPRDQDPYNAFKLAEASQAMDISAAILGEEAGDAFRSAIAASFYVYMNLPETATFCIGLLSTQIKDYDARQDADLATLLVRAEFITAAVCAYLGDTAKRLWQQALFEMVRISAERSFPDLGQVWRVIHQLAKGRSLAAAMQRDRHDFERQTIGVSARFRTLIQLDLDPEDLTADEGLTNDPWNSPRRASWFAASMQELEMSPGATKAEFAANGRRVYHRVLLHALNRSGLVPLEFRALSDIQGSIGPATCLVSLLAGDMKGFGNTITGELMTRGDVRCIAAYSQDGPPFTAAYVDYSGGGREGVLNLPVYFSIAPFIIEAIQEDPLQRVVSREAERLLRETADWLRPILDLLGNDDLTAGMTNLYIWPHGAGHILPFWLLPFGEGVIADHFTVSLLPCLEPIFWTARHAPGEGVLAIASAGGGVSYGLPFEASTENSAGDIAAIFGCDPLIGDLATSQVFLSQAGQTPYIHLAAHGLQDPKAPMFHCVFLNGEDGRLFADQILQCDLRAVRLVTIEACESLLVRFDCEDNLTGLPSIFLRAGAGAVVGALWSVRPEVSALFFLTLYQGLQHGDAIFAAFNRAQGCTRQSFPQYQDWGTFCLIGFGG